MKYIFKVSALIRENLVSLISLVLRLNRPSLSTESQTMPFNSVSTSTPQLSLYSPKSTSKIG